MTVRAVRFSRPGRQTLRAPGVHLHRAFGNGDEKRVRPLPHAGRLSAATTPTMYQRGLPLAPAPRHRDHHLHARGRGRPRRLHGQRGHHRRRRCAVDDGGQRHHPPGDAQGRRQGRMGGFQLWLNLPAAHKMTDPRYQGVRGGQDPEVEAGRRRGAGHRRHGGRRGRPGDRHLRRPGVPRRDARRRGVVAAPDAGRAIPSSPTSSRGAARFGGSRRAGRGRPGERGPLSVTATA